MRVMFTAVLGGFMDHQFGLDVKRAVLKPMVEGSIEVYLRVSQDLLPTPARAHYTFNLRDLSKVFEGILMIKARQVGFRFHHQLYKDYPFQCDHHGLRLYPCNMKHGV